MSEANPIPWPLASKPEGTLPRSSIRRSAWEIVCSLTLSVLSAVASAQVLHEAQELPCVDEHDFGRSVSAFGDVAFVGALGSSDNGFDSGSVLVFRWNGSTWMYEQELLAFDGAEYDYFGSSVSVSGDVAIVGAQSDDSNGTNAGSAYIFHWNGATWVHEQELLAFDGAESDGFGISVSVSGDVALVGAYGDDENGADSGSAHVYRWSGSTWVHEQKLLASDGAAYDNFGASVSISGDVAVVGAWLDDDNGTGSGSAYVFRWNGAMWLQEQKLFPLDESGNDGFGASVSFAGNIGVVGAPFDDDNGYRSGSAYIFRWNGSAWVYEQELLASDGAVGAYFGWSGSVSGDVAVVGAWAANDEYGVETGAAYLFRWSGSTWVLEQKLLASDGAAYDTFGWSVSVTDHVALVGAPSDDCGSAYVFNLYCDPGHYGPMCLECPGGASNPCNGQAPCDDGVDGSGVCLCDDGIACTSDSFDYSGGTCNFYPNDALCDADSYCNGAEICNPVVGCQGTPIVCDDDDGIACTVATCDELRDVCFQNPDDSLCDDGVYCNGLEYCDSDLGCKLVIIPDCNDGIGCTVDICDEASRSCLHAQDVSICGSCCLQGGSCVNGVTAEECATASGAFVQGAVCEGVAACCLPDESCVDVDATCCQAQGGIPDIAGVLCNDDDFFGCVVPIPAVSAWGLFVLTLLTLTAAKLAFRARQPE